MLKNNDTYCPICGMVVFVIDYTCTEDLYCEICNKIINKNDCDEEIQSSGDNNE